MQKNTYIFFSINEVGSGLSETQKIYTREQQKLIIMKGLDALFIWGKKPKTLIMAQRCQILTLYFFN